MPNIVIKSEEKRLAEVLVYEPMTVDTDGEAMTANDIEQLAYSFLAAGRATKIDIEHNFEESGSAIVESYIARSWDPNFPTGSWVVTLKVNNDLVWQKILNGEINGVSWAGNTTRVPVLAKLTEITKAAGTTELSIAKTVEPHEHSLTIEFDGTSIKPTRTGETDGHTHEVVKMTAVESTLGHGHGIKIEDES